MTAGQKAPEESHGKVHCHGSARPISGLHSRRDSFAISSQFFPLKVAGPTVFYVRPRFLVAADSRLRRVCCALRYQPQRLKLHESFTRLPQANT